MRSEKGFTLIEMLLVVTIFGLMAAMIGSRAAPLMTRTGAGQAAAAVALDLEQAVSLAARQRKPVRISCDCGNQALLITDRAAGTVLYRRPLGGNGGYGVTALALSTSPVDVFPSGLTSAALTVTVTASQASRQVTMSTGGFVRVVR